jgi:hypothetical protein
VDWPPQVPADPRPSPFTIRPFDRGGNGALADNRAELVNDGLGKAALTAEPESFNGRSSRFEPVETRQHWATGRLAQAQALCNSILASHTTISPSRYAISSGRRRRSSPAAGRSPRRRSDPAALDDLALVLKDPERRRRALIRYPTANSDFDGPDFRLYSHWANSVL